MKHLFLFLLLCMGLFSCKKDTEGIQKDLCRGIICKNGGDCVNGDCKCPPQWTGSDCSQQKTPTNIVISKIQVNKFPANAPNGGSWDLGSGADMYLVIKSGSTIVYTSGYIENAVGSVIFTPNFILPNPTGIYDISIYDYDSLDADDFMGGIQGTLYNSTNGFPAIMDFTCGTCSVGYSISLGYTW